MSGRQNRLPIHRAIATVLKSAGRPLTPIEVYQEIESRKLYSFKAQDPLHVVTSDLRRHAKELNFPSARPMKYFTLGADGRFGLLSRPEQAPPTLFRSSQRKLVSVPTDDEGEADPEPKDGPGHTEIQWRLLDLGSQMGLSVWAPFGDRGKSWGRRRIEKIPSLLRSLPVRFDEATRRTVENIDVLWLERESIVAGFEVEHTTTIYSGLLRMSDLVTMQPNIVIRLYLVGPDERRAKFAREVARPTFASVPKPLHSVCRFLPYTSLVQRLEEGRNLIRHLKPDFLNDIAEPYDPTETGE